MDLAQKYRQLLQSACMMYSQKEQLEIKLKMQRNKIF